LPEPSDPSSPHDALTCWLAARPERDHPFHRRRCRGTAFQALDAAADFGREIVRLQRLSPGPRPGLIARAKANLAVVRREDARARALGFRLP